MESRPQICKSLYFLCLSCSGKKKTTPKKTPTTTKTTADLAGSKVPFQFISLQCSLRIPMTCGEWFIRIQWGKKMAETGLVIYYGTSSRFRDFWHAGGLSAKELLLICLQVQVLGWFGGNALWEPAETDGRQKSPLPERQGTWNLILANHPLPAKLQFSLTVSPKEDKYRNKILILSTFT